MTEDIKKASRYATIGVNSDYDPKWGLRQDDFLTDLRGERGIRRFREMSENDPIVGAVLSAMDLMIRSTPWRVEDGSEQARELVDDCMNHLEDVTFEMFLSDVLSFLPYGFSLFEIVARRPAQDPKRKGRITLKSLAPRAQWTIDRFETDRTGKILGVHQQAATGSAYIPYSKLLHFRTASHQNDPAGRALDPKTPIITPDGWRTMDDLKVGDKVFDEKGRIRYVTGRRDWEDRPCYEVAFSSGETIVADANHQWAVVDGKKRGAEKGVPTLMTTEEILNVGVYWGAEGTSHANTSRWSVPWCDPLDFPEQHLPLDPYYFGYWLGDGNTRNSTITTHVDDVADLVTHLHDAGFTAKVELNGAQGGKGRVVRVQGSAKWAADAPGRALHVMGVTKGKFIPENYLRGSYAQRFALLQGLMDSDGYVDDYGRCEFSNVNKSLADSVAHLLRSLGIGARVTSGVNSAGNTRYRVSFTPTQETFRLPRKRARVKAVRAREAHYIRSIEPTAPRRTVCIEIDGPSHLFLCGESMIPTHNSVLRTAYTSWYFARRIQEIEAIAIERELNGLPIFRIPSEYLSPDATPEQRAFASKIAVMGRDVKRNEMGHMVLPSDYYEDADGKLTNNRMVEFELAASKGTRDIKTGEVIIRYQQDMARSALADFVLLGTNDRGSFALSKSKADLFLKALEGYLDAIASVLNRKLVPKLLAWNGIDMADAPQIVHGRVAPVDLKEMGDYVARLAGVGIQLTDDASESHLRTVGGLPPSSGDPDPNAPASPTGDVRGQQPASGNERPESAPNGTQEAE